MTKLLTYGWRRQVLHPGVLLDGIARLLDELGRVTSAAAIAMGDDRWMDATTRLLLVARILRGHPTT